MIKGYARVSTDGQTLEAQQEALRAAGATQVFAEKQSGVKTDRAALARCLGSLEPGDTLLVTKLDRLARSTRDLLNTLDTITKARATFRSLGDGWADTTTPHGKLMITVLGGLAEFERHLILSRTAEGRVRAKARGVKFGRRPKLTKYQRDEARARLAQGETLSAVARSFGVSHITISRLAGCCHNTIGPDKLGAGNQALRRWSLGLLFWGRTQLPKCGRKNFEVPAKYIVGTFCCALDQLIMSAQSNCSARLTAGFSCSFGISGAAGSCSTVACWPSSRKVKRTI